MIIFYKSKNCLQKTYLKFLWDYINSENRDIGYCSNCVCYFKTKETKCICCGYTLRRRRKRRNLKIDFKRY